MKKLDNVENKREPLKKVKTQKVKRVPAAKPKTISKQLTTPASGRKVKIENGGQKMSEADLRQILNKILLIPPPVNMKRMNIIIKDAIYAPSTSKSIVLGKRIEKENWEIVEPPAGVTDLDTSKIRVFVDENSKIINAIEIFQTAGIKNVSNKANHPKKSTQKVVKTIKKITKKDSVKKKATRKKSSRTLPKIPSRK